MRFEERSEVRGVGDIGDAFLPSRITLFLSKRCSRYFWRPHVAGLVPTSVPFTAAGMSVILLPHMISIWYAGTQRNARLKSEFAGWLGYIGLDGLTRGSYPLLIWRNMMEI